MTFLLVLAIMMLFIFSLYLKERFSNKSNRNKSFCEKNKQGQEATGCGHCACTVDHK